MRRRGTSFLIKRSNGTVRQKILCVCRQLWGGSLRQIWAHFFFAMKTLHLACLLFRQKNRREFRVVASKKINAHKNGRHLSRQKIFFFCFRRTNAESKVASERELFSCQIKFPTFKMEYYFLLTLQSSFYMSSGRDSVSAESALWPLTEGRSGASFSDSDSDPEFSLSVETVEYMIPVSGSTALSSTSV